MINSQNDDFLCWSNHFQSQKNDNLIYMWVVWVLIRMQNSSLYLILDKQKSYNEQRNFEKRNCDQTAIV